MGRNLTFSEVFMPEKVRFRPIFARYGSSEAIAHYDSRHTPEWGIWRLLFLFNRRVSEHNLHRAFIRHDNCRTGYGRNIN